MGSNKCKFDLLEPIAEDLLEPAAHEPFEALRDGDVPHGSHISEDVVFDLHAIMDNERLEPVKSIETRLIDPPARDLDRLDGMKTEILDIFFSNSA